MIVDEGGIQVAHYLTELPPIDVQCQKLHRPVSRANQHWKIESTNQNREAVPWQHGLLVY